MALQTKTFTWGSYAHKSESNAYILELTLTENSTSQANNTSEIAYTLKLKSGSSNRFQDDVRSTIKLNGVTVATGAENKYLDYNSSWTLLDGTATVTHNTDGTLDMPVEVSIDVDTNQYAPPDKTLTWSWALTTIPRASSIVNATNVTLGNNCSVSWVPNSSSFWYWLWFELGDWNSGWIPSANVGIYPGHTNYFTYTGYQIPLSVADYITNGKTGTMKVKLYTFPNSAGKMTELIGQADEREFTVTVPENDETRPVVAFTDLKAVNTFEGKDLFEGLYLQGETRINATISATGKYGATIESTGFTVEGKDYTSESNSDCVTKTGTVEITGSAEDSRGISGYAKQTVTVLPYYVPKLTGVEAFRCTDAGIAADNGEYLKIRATRDYAPVIVDGVQHNFCDIQYCYKAENAAGFSKPETILAADADENKVETEPLLNATFRNDTAYMVQIIATDTVGRSRVATVAIPSERVFRHKRAGGKGLGLGGFCENDNLLDVHWNQRVRKDLNVDGNINNVYIRAVRLSGSKTITVQSKISVFAENSTQRQSIFMFGFDNGLLVSGVAGFCGNGSAGWGGTEGVAVTALEDGRFAITLPATAYDWFTLLSAEPFSLL